MSKLGVYEMRRQLEEMNSNYVVENNIKEWANKSAYIAKNRGAFGETPEASERKQRYGRV